MTNLRCPNLWSGCSGDLEIREQLAGCGVGPGRTLDRATSAMTRLFQKRMHEAALAALSRSAAQHAVATHGDASNTPGCTRRPSPWPAPSPAASNKQLLEGPSDRSGGSFGWWSVVGQVVDTARCQAPRNRRASMFISILVPCACSQQATWSRAMQERLRPPLHLRLRRGWRQVGRRNCRRASTAAGSGRRSPPSSAAAWPPSDPEAEVLPRALRLSRQQASSARKQSSVRRPLTPTRCVAG